MITRAGWLLVAALALPCAAPAARADDVVLREAIGLAGPAIWLASGAPGMVLALVRGDDTLVTGYGETEQGNGHEPDGRSLLRIGSVSKVLTTEVLADLVVEGQVRLDQTLQQWMPEGFLVPSDGGRAITLLDLATHSAGLPREIGDVPTRPAPFIWPTQAERDAFLAHYTLPWAPGGVAAYSNVNFMFLADALAQASGQSYPALLRDRLTGPLGMADTGVHPTPDQCARLMTGSGLGGPGPCTDTSATAGSGGVYSTGDDMARWLRHLVRDDPGASPAVALAVSTYRLRQQMPAAIGFDEAGAMAGLGLGWVIEAAHDQYPVIIAKTGGGGGFMNYLAFVPGHRLGIFLAVNRVDFGMFRGLTSAANGLLASLAIR